MSVPIREYIDHICEKHQHSGTIQETLVKLHTKLKKEVGDFDPGAHLTMAQCLDTQFMHDLGFQRAKYGDLAYLEGFLETKAGIWLDCNCDACKKVRK